MNELVCHSQIGFDAPLFPFTFIGKPLPDPKRQVRERDMRRKSAQCPKATKRTERHWAVREVFEYSPKLFSADFSFAWDRVAFLVMERGDEVLQTCVHISLLLPPN